MFASTSGYWPSLTLTNVPPLTVAERLAADVRDAAGLSSRRRLDLDPLLLLGRFDLRSEPLGARGGGIEAALAPRRDNRFVLTVDSEPRGGWSSVAPCLREDLARHRLRFRVVHEIGHSFFYDRLGGRPRRTVANSVEQERWCDRFASAVLLPPATVARRPASPQALLRLQDQFDVSLHVVVRAFARVHRQRFAALLVARGARPPHLRVQWQKRHCAPPARWWTDEALQHALEGRARHGALELQGPAGKRAAAWYAMPHRRQVMVLA
jgi:hypothetical protein